MPYYAMVLKHQKIELVIKITIFAETLKYKQKAILTN